MGRADLARYRKTSQSDIRPTAFPKRATWTLQHLPHPNAALNRAVTSFRDAPSQRTQVAAVKVLNVAIRDAHLKTDDARGSTPCACIHGEGVPVCRIADSVLAGLLFESPDATAGLVAASLRAFLRSRVKLPEVEQAKDDFFQRLEAAGREHIGLTSENPDLTGFVKDQFLSLVTDLGVTAVLLSDTETNSWILDHDLRIHGVLRNVSFVSRIYQETSISDQAVFLDTFDFNGDENAADIGVVHNRINASLNRKMLESACDAAMKAGQDILKVLCHKKDVLSNDTRSIVKEVVKSCQSILKLSSLPRNCAMACAVAFITGLMLTSENLQHPVIVERILREKVLSSLDYYPLFSQLSLLRGVMEAPVSIPALPFILFPSHNEATEEKAEKSTVFEFVASITTNSSDVHLRFLAMDTLIACLRHRAPQPLSVYCRDVVLKLVYERLQEPFPGVPSQIREAMESLVVLDGGGKQASQFWLDMAISLVNSDWHAKGMYAPLSVLVKRIGALRLLEAAPTCQFMAMCAAGTDSRLAKPIADWLGAFWKSLRHNCEQNPNRFKELTIEPLVKALISENNHALRERVAEHMLPVYFRSIGKELVEDCAVSLLHYLDKITPEKSVSRIRGTVSIMSVARHNGVFIASFSDPSVFALLQEALRCGEEDMRAAALDLVVTCRVSTEPIMQQELDLVLIYLPIALMPGGSPSDRSRFRHSMRRFFERLAACRHAAERDGSGGWWMRERKEKYGGFRTTEFEEQRLSLLHRLSKFERACTMILLASSYPGAIFGRKTNALEVLTLLSNNLGLGTFDCYPKVSSRAVVAALMQGLVDEWERPRHAAFRMISSWTSPTLWLNNLDEWNRAQQFAVVLLNSPRQKAVDAGALICRVLFRKVAVQRFDVANCERSGSEIVLLFPCEKKADIDKPIYQSDQCGLLYADSVLDSVQDVLQNAEVNFSRTCEHGLFHGRFLLLRYLFQDLPWKECLQPQYLEMASSFIARFLSLAQSCIRIAMEGVSFSAFNEQMNEDVTNVNEEGDDDNDNIFLKNAKQLESTSCFLSMKEICICLGILCHEVPFSDVSMRKGSSGLLTLPQIESIGNAYRHVFMNTRHWGVIDGAAEGFQLLCERLLQNSDIHLRSLPKQWALETLSIALRGKLYVLRRSAGIPAFINAVVNAEACSHARSLESPILTCIISTILDHLRGSYMFTDEKKLCENRSKEEDSISHALNLLRSLFLNGNIAGNILKHLELAMIYCINAFCSASWLIRNSAMMLFSALIRRGIGVCAEKKTHAPASSFSAVGGTSATMDGERRLHGITAFQFFSRHPKLHPFLLDQLESSVFQMEKHQKGDHPSLFPTLYLLSSLSPGAAEDPSVTISMSPFRVLLRKCSHWRSDYVRRVAAAASVSLIEDPSHVGSVVSELLLTGVPEEPARSNLKFDKERFETVQTEVFSNPHNSSLPVLRQNDLHGELLTIGAILDGTRRVMSVQDKYDTVVALANLLPQRIWIATDGWRNPCSYTRSAMLSVLSKSYNLACDVRHMRDINLKHKQSSEMVITICGKVSEIFFILEGDDWGKPAEVGVSCLRINASRLQAQTVFDSLDQGKLSFLDSLTSLSRQVHSSSYDTKKAGLENCLYLIENELMKPLKSIEASKEKDTPCLVVLQSVWNSATKLLSSCKQQEVTVGALRLQIVILDYLEMNHATTPSLFRKSTDEYLSLVSTAAQSHACVDVREYALILLGKIVSVFSNRRNLVEEWIRAIEAGSLGSTVTTKRAVCTSLFKSGLGVANKWKNSHKDIAARGYLTFARLLEDDCTDTKAHAARMTRQCLFVEGQYHSIPQDTLPTLMRVFEKLSAEYANCGSLIRYLRALLGENNDGPSDDPLMTLVDSVVDYKDSAPPDIGSSMNFNRVKNEENSNNISKLFMLEDESSHGELILRLQTISYCYQKATSNRSCQKGAYADGASAVCKDLVVDLETRLMQEFGDIDGGIVGNNLFLIDGFANIYKKILRISLGICCFRALGGKVLNDVQLTLKKILSECGPRLHPTLTGAIHGVHATLCGIETSSSLTPLQQILFLLPV